MLSRTEELTALFETLGVLSCALMACLSRGWRTAIDQARAQIPSVEEIDDDWVHQQRQFWAERHHKRVKNFQSDFLMSVLPRFYTGLGKLRIGLLPRRIDPPSATTDSPYRRYHRFPKVDLRFPVLDEALRHLTSSCTQLRELDVARQHSEMSNVSLMIVASNCSNLQKLTFGSGGSIFDVGLAALAQGCKQLEHLEILGLPGYSRSRGFTHEGVMAVARSCRLLKTLELPASRTLEDPALLALSQYCPLLRSLSFHGSDITDAAVAALVHGCPQLEVVELPYARITDASASALAQGCPNLKTLDLLQTDVTAAGVLTLAKHAKHMLTIRIGCMDGAAARALAEEYPVEVSAQIKLTVVSQDGNEIYFQIKETTPLQKLMHAYCNRQGIAPNKIRFLFDGNCINETETPQQLEMVDDDIIDVMVEFGYGA